MVHKNIQGKKIAIHPLQLTNGVTVYVEKIPATINVTQDSDKKLLCNTGAVHSTVQPMNLFGGDSFV